MNKVLVDYLKKKGFTESIYPGESVTYYSKMYAMHEVPEFERGYLLDDPEGDKTSVIVEFRSDGGMWQYLVDEYCFESFYPEDFDKSIKFLKDFRLEADLLKDCIV